MKLLSSRYRECIEVSEHEQSWPIVMSKSKKADCLELKRSSVSFFEIDKHETATSRWSRARIRAAKIGKGLSKNSKAQKLVKLHWLEAIDPQHRYGHNLHFYYEKWLESSSQEPFFYWLDIGEGKEINLVEKCPRSKLQQQCVEYLGPSERTSFEVVVDNDGKLLHKQTKVFVNTTTSTTSTPNEPKDDKWIFVLSPSMVLYVGKKKKGSFQHSSFLSGGATSAAGNIIVENGILKAVWPYSGHYMPKPETFQVFIAFLKENNVDLTNVKHEPVVETTEVKSVNLRYEDMTKKSEGEAEKYDRSELETLKGSSSDLEIIEVYQMGKQLSHKWSICADPPTGLQCYTLEQQQQRNLSSRGGANVRSKEEAMIKKTSFSENLCCRYPFSSTLHKFTSSTVVIVDR